MYRVSPTLTPGVIDVSGDAPRPWDRLHPWYQHYQIPVPTVHGMHSATVNGILEAMCLVGPWDQPGHINLGYLAGGQRTREILPGHLVKGWLCGGRPVGLREAREALLIPAYHWVLNNPAAPLVTVLRQRHATGDVWLFDGVSNDCLATPGPLSHAHLLVEFLNTTLH